jgi:lipoate---protein ligase
VVIRLLCGEVKRAGAVLVGLCMVGPSVFLPRRHSQISDSLLDSYSWLGCLHAKALRDVGVDAIPLAPASNLLISNSASCVPWACFGAVSAWEVVDRQGRKIVGLAQRRRANGVLLVAGTLVAEPQWALLCRAFGRDDDLGLLRARTTNCAQLSSKPVTRNRFAAVLERHLKATLEAVR